MAGAKTGNLFASLALIFVDPVILTRNLPKEELS